MSNGGTGIGSVYLLRVPVSGAEGAWAELADVDRDTCPVPNDSNGKNVKMY